MHVSQVMMLHAFIPGTQINGDCLQWVISKMTLSGWVFQLSIREKVLGKAVCLKSGQCIHSLHSHSISYSRRQCLTRITAKIYNLSIKWKIMWKNYHFLPLFFHKNNTSFPSPWAIIQSPIKRLCSSQSMYRISTKPSP